MSLEGKLRRMYLARVNMIPTEARTDAFSRGKFLALSPSGVKRKFGHAVWGVLEGRESFAERSFRSAPKDKIGVKTGLVYVTDAMTSKDVVVMATASDDSDSPIVWPRQKRRTRRRQRRLLSIFCWAQRGRQS